MKAYEILPWSSENLARALSNQFLKIPDVKDKFHFDYFCRYLGPVGLGAKHILIEFDYVSRAYLDDYATYYAYCFEPYQRRCRRVHFFTRDFDPEGFHELLLNDEAASEVLQETYLGHIVVKPLPKTNIGPTVLRTFPNQDGVIRRFYPAKTYHVSLFGVPLQLESLVFQEQDRVVSACATSALWSAFHKTSELFRTPLPSPSEITASADNLFLNSGRTFPNHGLDLFQIGKAINHVGLESELRVGEAIKSVNWLKAFIYAYCRMGLPALIGLEIGDRGYHLIAVSGFREVEKVRRLTEDLSLVGEQIDYFYVHDDQVGPFSRIGFTDDNLIRTGWPKETNLTEMETAVPISISIPLSKKIRITFEDVYYITSLVDYLLYHLDLTDQEVVWDIYLEQSSVYKSEIQRHPDLPSELKEKILLQNLPRYIWVSRALILNEPIVELIFDSTNISDGRYCKQVNFWNPQLESILWEEMNADDVQDFIYRRHAQDGKGWWIFHLVYEELARLQESGG